MSILLITDAVPLLSGLRVQHGPREVLGQYFLDVSMQLRERGIEVLLSRDVNRFAKLGPDYDQARPALFPAMDARVAGFGAENWFTIEGRDDQDRLAFFGAARLLRLKNSLKEELETLRLLYIDPASQCGDDDSAEVTAPSAATVSGFVALLGSYWVSPRLRGTGLARVFPGLCRYYSFTLWNIDYAVGFLRQHDAEKGLTTAYGEPAPERWVKFRGQWSDDSYIAFNPRAGIEAGLYAAAEVAKSRAILTADTFDNSALPSDNRHGRISR